VAKEYEALVARKQTDKSKDLRKHRREISEYLKQEIVARYYFQKGRLRATFAGDPEVQKALSLLADPSAFKQILWVP